MVDVFGIEILKRSEQELAVASGIGNLHIDPTRRIQERCQIMDDRLKISDVFKDVRQDDQIKATDPFGHLPD